MRAEGHATNDSATDGTTQLLRRPMPRRSDDRAKRLEHVPRWPTPGRSEAAAKRLEPAGRAVDFACNALLPTEADVQAMTIAEA